MMTNKFRIILILILLLALIGIIRMVRKRSIELKYVLSWIIVDVIVLIIVLIPGLLDGIAALMGVYSVMNMVFFLGFCFLLIITFTLTVALSHNSNKLRKMAQEIALSGAGKKNGENDRDGENSGN